jgi:hypothetical protein
MEIQNTNSYDSNKWRDQFPVVFEDLVKRYDHAIYTYQEMNVLKAVLHHTVYDAPYEVLDKYNIINALPYYYIQWILENKPNVILDVGCGTSPFKNLISNIVGIDNHLCPPPYDKDSIQCHFDEDFAVSHQKMCDALISVNAIHFSPIWTIRSKMLDLAKLLRPGGRAFVAFNAETWLMSTPRPELQQRFGNYPDTQCLLEYMYEQTMNAGLNFLVSDWPVTQVSEHSPIRDDVNGNVRLVFEVDSRI